MTMFRARRMVPPPEPPAAPVPEPPLLRLCAPCDVKWAGDAACWNCGKTAS